jgi:Flp pilus assembly protein TadB
VTMTTMAGREWQSAMAERWERRRKSRPPVPGPPQPVPVRTWRRVQLLALVLSLLLLVANGLWLGSRVVIVAAVTYVVFFCLGEWLWRRYLKPPSG